MSAATLTGSDPIWDDLELIETTVMNPSQTSEEVKVFYNAWAESGKYDNINGPNVYGSPFKMQQAMDELFPVNKGEVRLLEVGAGTGLSGKLLLDSGFTKMDALDASAGMLSVAREKGIYKKYINAMLTGDQLDIPPDTYDAIFMVGVIGFGCVPVAAFNEMVRLVKPGGYIVNCMRAEHLQTLEDYAQNWEPLADRMERENKWKTVKLEKYPNHYIGSEGLLQIYQVL